MRKRAFPALTLCDAALAVIIIMFVIIACLVSAQVGYTGHESFAIPSSFGGQLRLPFAANHEIMPWYANGGRWESNGLFYYALIDLWSRWGWSELWWWRLPSLLFGVGALALTYALGKRLDSSRLGLFAAFALAINMSVVAVSVHCRFYSLALFLMLAATWSLLRASAAESSRQKFWTTAWTITAVLMVLSVSSMLLTTMALLAVILLQAVRQRSRWGWQRAAVLATLVSLTFLGLWWRDMGGLHRVFYPHLDVAIWREQFLALFGFGFANVNVPACFHASLVNTPLVMRTTEAVALTTLAVLLGGMVMSVYAYRVKRRYSEVSWCAWLGWFGFLFLAIFSLAVHNIYSLPNTLWLLPWFALGWAAGMLYLPRFGRWLVLLIVLWASTFFSLALFADGEGTGRAWRTMEAYRQRDDYVLVYDSSVTRTLCSEPRIFVPPAHLTTPLQGALFMADISQVKPGQITFVESEQLSRLLSCAATDPCWRGHRLWILEKSAERPYGIALERAIAARFALRPGMCERIYVQGCGRERLWLVVFPEDY